MREKIYLKYEVNIVKKLQLEIFSNKNHSKNKNKNLQG